MTTRIVLAMHGMPAKDFPEDEVIELVKLHRIMDKAGNHAPSDMRHRYTQLDHKIRNWKRTPENDPFWASSIALAEEMQAATGFDVIVGFNEFCGPSLENAIDAAASAGATKVIVVTPMMTPGGEHSEEDIPEAISSAKSRYEGVEFIYAWPFPTTDVVSFLASQIRKFHDT
jgi:sirohydrochlorin cobaltochelatase